MLSLPKKEEYKPTLGVHPMWTYHQRKGIYRTTPRLKPLPEESDANASEKETAK